MDGHCCEGNKGMKNQSLKNTTDQWHSRALSRSNCYGLLALVFRDTPTVEITAQLRARPLAEALSRLGYDVASDLAGEIETVTDQLHEQYTRTFVGPGPHVSPYASVHVSHEARLWGDSTVWVKRFVETTGLSFKSSRGSIPDHIAIELELMQRLTAHEAQLWGQIAAHSNEKKNADKRLSRCLQAQENFLRDHLCKWIPQFCKRILETSTSSFYQKMARLAKSITFSDVDQVAGALKALKCNSYA